MTETRPIQFRQEATPFEDGDELEFHKSELRSKAEIETEKYQDVMEGAFRIIQHQKILNNEMLSPTSPVEQARVYSAKMPRVRGMELSEMLTAEPLNPVAWLQSSEKPEKNPLSGNIVSMEHYRAQKNRELEEAA